MARRRSGAAIRASSSIPTGIPGRSRTTQAGDRRGRLIRRRSPHRRLRPTETGGRASPLPYGLMTTEAGRRFDFVVIGAGPAGEAAAYKARELGASVAVVERDLFGGSCPHWGCIPSKSLLNGALRHALGARLPLGARVGPARLHDQPRRARLSRRQRATCNGLEAAGATGHPRRGPPRWSRTGRRRGHGAGRPARSRGRRRATLQATEVVIAVGSSSKVPPVDGHRDASDWTNRDATSTRRLPHSLLVLGGGPTGVELAQVYARFGVPDRPSSSRAPRLAPTDHPRNSEAALRALERDGVTVRLGVRALAARAGAGARGADVIELDDGSTADGHVTLLAVGRDLPARRARPRVGRPRAGATCPATDGCGSATDCGWSATRQDRSCTRTRRTTRASWRSAWRVASPSRPTTAPCRGRPTSSPSWPSSA